jgi:transcriptional regulator with XRE-family HTH domain
VSVWTVEQLREALASGEGWHREQRSECYLWEERSPDGYGPFELAYEAHFGPVPEGMRVGHVCAGGRRGCIRPAHLEAIPAGARNTDVDPALVAEMPGFPRRIRDEREARGMTRAEFAKELRVAPSTLKAWERGERLPAMDLLKWLVGYLGWAGEPQTYVVTALVQRYERANSSGDALRLAWEHIERMNGGPRKAAVVSVKPVARGRRAVRGSANGRRQNRRAHRDPEAGDPA